MIKVPRAPTKNPFKSGGMLTRQFDLVLKAYADGHKDMRRGAGNLLASCFWKGYDMQPPISIPRDSLAWACYRAGQFQRRSRNELPPRS